MKANASRNEMKLRLLVAAVGVPLLILVIMVGGYLFAIAVAVFLAIASYEMTTHWPKKASIAVTIFTVLLTATFTFTGLKTQWLTIGCLVLLGLAFNSFMARDSATNLARYGPWLITTLAYLGFLGAHFNALRGLNNGLDWCVLVLTSIFATDTGALVSGKLIGRHQMAPSISPGKTWEGTIGGFMCGFTAVPFMNWCLSLGLAQEHQVLLGSLIPLAAILGDLFESKLKRVMGVKDMGSLLPGHGGVCDRIDSWLFAVPVAYYYLQLFVL